MRVCTKCRTIAMAVDDTCHKCKGELLQSPPRWSPPKKNNRRAWRRIEKGEWLWDRRRLRRNPRRMGATYPKLPTDKPGQHRWGQWPVARKHGADVDLGG